MMAGLLINILVVSMGLAAGKPSNYMFGGPGISRSMFQQCPIADGFDFPVGKAKALRYPVGKPSKQYPYYNAQHFGRNNHLGDDWNGNRGGNTDLGDPIYAIGHGIVISAREEGAGWGKVIRVLHNKGSTENPEYIESVYAHMDKMLVKRGETIKRRQKIGTIGTANGRYYAHLHLEVRDQINNPIGLGYSANRDGFLDPTKFIMSHRPKHRKRYRLGHSRRVNRKRTKQTATLPE